MCLWCRRRYVPEGRTVAQTCPHCGELTAKRRAKDSEIRKLADDLFALWVRLRDFGRNKLCMCITCAKMFVWDDVDAGHFVERGRDATRYDELNVHGQCRFCNRPHGTGKHWKDMSWEYGRNIDVIYGEGTAARLKEKANESFKYDRAGLLDVARTYRDKIGNDGHDCQYILDRYKAAVIEMDGFEK